MTSSARDRASESRIVILGGGPAGLVAGLALARRGLAVSLLEAEDRPGGLCAGIEVAGLLCDLGSHRLHRACAPPLRALIEDVLARRGVRLRERRRRGRIVLDGEVLAFPLRPLELLQRLGPRTLAAIAGDRVGALVSRDRVVETYADRVEAELGRTLLERFHGPYARKVWGRDPTDLSSELARRRATGERGLFGKLTDMLTGRSSRYLYPDAGFGAIPAALAEAFQRAGGELHLGTRVEGLTVPVFEAGSADPAPALEVSASGSSGPRLFRPSLVLSTLPATTLAGILSPSLPAALVTALSSGRFRGLRLLYLVVPVSRWSDAEAWYFPGPEVSAARISEPRHYLGAMGETGSTVLCVELPADPGEPLWEEAADALVGLLRDQLAAIGLTLPEPIAIKERRLPRAWPLHDATREAAIPELDEALRARPGLLAFGRQARLGHDNLHHAMRTGLAVAEAIGDDGRIGRSRFEAALREADEATIED